MLQMERILSRAKRIGTLCRTLGEVPIQPTVVVPDPQGHHLQAQEQLRLLAQELEQEQVLQVLKSSAIIETSF